MVIPVETTETSFKFGTPVELFRGNYLSPNLGTQYSVTKDGRRFLMIKSAEPKEGVEESRKIIVVTNRLEELKEKAPVHDRKTNLRSYMYVQKGGFHMKNLSIVLGLLLLAGFAFAADIDGKWAGEIVDQNMEIAFTFKAEGTKLTGVHIVNGQETPIEEGKIDGNKISFTVTLNMGEDMKIPHKGTISGDEIKMTYEMMGQPGEILVKRVK